MLVTTDVLYRRIPAMAHAVYRHLGRNLFDALYLSRNPDRFCERFVTADDFSKLEEAYRQRWWAMVRLNTNPEWDPLRSDPRFRALLARMKFP